MSTVCQLSSARTIQKEAWQTWPPPWMEQKLSPIGSTAPLIPTRQNKGTPKSPK